MNNMLEYNGIYTTVALCKCKGIEAEKSYRGSFNVCFCWDNH